MRTTATTVSLLLTAALLASCGHDDDKPDEPATSNSAPNTSAEPTPTPTQSRTPHGPTIERPGYSYNLPESWIDSTDQQMLATELDSYGMRDQGDIYDSDNVLTVSVETSVPKQSYLNAFSSVLDSMRTTEPPDIKRVEDTEWAGAGTAHARGPLPEGKGYLQIFYFWHHDAGYYISLQTTGNQKENERLLDVVRSSWTWK